VPTGGGISFTEVHLSDRWRNNPGRPSGVGNAMSETAAFVAVARASRRHERINRRCRVWAPRAQRVELAIEGERLDMIRSADAWWTSDHGMQDGEALRLRRG